jgi:ABC-2 type transport system permease protein
LATFAEAFSSIGWAATAAVAAASLSLAIAPALLAFLVVAGTWFMSPRLQRV